MNYTVTVEHTTQAGLAYTVHARNLLEAAFLAGRVSIPDGYTLVDVVAERPPADCACIVCDGCTCEVVAAGGSCQCCRGGVHQGATP